MAQDASQIISAGGVGRLRVGIVGYGEVGRIFAEALASARVARVAAFDVLVADASWASKARERAERDAVTLAADTRDATAKCGLVISAVTAAATAAAARQIADAGCEGAFVLDINSASPKTKQACAEIVAQAGGRYVEAAVMTSVPPHGVCVPMLLGGPHAEAAAPFLAQLGFNANVGSTAYGVVSAIKLCRSVVIKGMEALAIESMLAARRYGVEDEVLASLVETFPGMQWERQVDWFWHRVVQHGRRRAEEMREAAVTVRDAGVAPRMASATAETQAWVASLRSAGVFDGVDVDAGWRARADRIARDAT